MAKKGITPEKLKDLKEMAINGVVPGDIASALGISVSAVHHHKKLMREEGINFPDVRGQRPKTKPEDSQNTVISGSQQFVINGTRLVITGKPTVINIGPDSVSVDYE